MSFWYGWKIMYLVLLIFRIFYDQPFVVEADFFIYLTILLLETEYSGSGWQYHACWCPGSWSRQSISRHGIGSVEKTTCIIVPDLISSTCVKPNPRLIQHKYIALVIFETIQYVNNEFTFAASPECMCWDYETVGTVKHSRYISMCRGWRPWNSQAFEAV